MLISRNSVPRHTPDLRQQKELLLSTTEKERFDRCHATGLQAVGYQNRGGCGEKPSSTYRVLRDEEPIRDTNLNSQAYRSPDQVTVHRSNMVGQFYDLQRGKYVLREIPIPGRGLLRPGNLFRRLDWMGPKDLTALPDKAQSIDAGPNGQLAAAVDNKVLHWNRREGLTTLAEFDNPVTRLEYLADGELAVQVEEPLPAHYLIDGGEVHFVAEQDFDPETFAGRLAEATKGLGVLEDAPVESRERFARDPERFEKKSKMTKGHRHENRAATWDWKQQKLSLYHLDSGELQTLGPLLPEGMKLSETAWKEVDRRSELVGEGRFLVLRSQPGDVGEQDVVLWDLQRGECSYLPSVLGFELDGDAFHFLASDGGEHRYHPDRQPLTEQPWYEAGLAASERRQRTTDLRGEVSYVRFLQDASKESIELFLQSDHEWLPKWGSSYKSSESPQDGTVAVTVGSDLHLLDTKTMKARHLGKNQHALKPELTVSYWNWEPTWSEDGRYLATGVAAREGTQDVLLWDLKAEEVHLLPAVRDLKMQDGQAKFTSLDGRSRSLALDQLDELPNQDWFQAAAMGLEVSNVEVGDISQQVDGLEVGDHFLQVQ